MMATPSTSVVKLAHTLTNPLKYVTDFFNGAHTWLHDLRDGIIQTKHFDSKDHIADVNLSIVSGYLNANLSHDLTKHEFEIVCAHPDMMLDIPEANTSASLFDTRLHDILTSLFWEKVTLVFLHTALHPDIFLDALHNKLQLERKKGIALSRTLIYEYTDDPQSVSNVLQVMSIAPPSYLILLNMPKALPNHVWYIICSAYHASEGDFKIMMVGDVTNLIQPNSETSAHSDNLMGWLTRLGYPKFIMPAAEGDDGELYVDDEIPVSAEELDELEG